MPAPKYIADKLTLTPREQQIYLMVVRDGIPRRAIAEKLNVSEHTVVRHMQSIYKKKGASRCIELTIQYHNANTASDLAQKHADLLTECKELLTKACQSLKRIATNVDGKDAEFKKYL